MQAVGAALLFANSTAIVTDAFKKGKTGFGLGVNQIAATAGFLLGPVVGGVLVSISWQWIFLINVPIGIFGAVWGMLKLREPEKMPKKQNFDWKGAATFFLGMSGLLFAISTAAFPIGITMPEIYSILVVSLLLLSLFLFIELREAQPLIDLSLFKHKLFAIANLANLLSGLANGTVLFTLIFFLQGPYGQTPLEAGILIAPFGIASMLVGPLFGYLSDKYGSRMFTFAGMIISSAGLFGLSTIAASTPYPTIALCMTLIGLGSGMFNSPNNNAIMSSVDPDRRGIASGMIRMLSNTGIMFSIMIAFPLLLSHVSVQALIHVFLHGGGFRSNTVSLLAFESGMHEVFLLGGGIALFTAVISALRPRYTPMVEGM